ncbi:hypothetical protein Tco_1327872 [Tanacetum coccineum]
MPEVENAQSVCSVHKHLCSDLFHEEDRRHKHKPEWTIPSNDTNEPEKNWANVYVTTYQGPEENKLQRKTGYIGSFINDATQKQRLQTSYSARAAADECYKLLTVKVDLVNPEGHQILRNVYEPLPLGGPPGQDHLKMEMEMEIPSSSNVKLITECSDTTYTCYEVMKDLIKVSKLPQTLISYSSSQSAYANSAPLSNQWEICNSIVLSWLLNFVSEDLLLDQIFSDNVAEVWAELKETYDKLDGFIIFNLLQKIHGFKQSELTISEYYYKLNSLWREFGIMTKLPKCSCAAREDVLKHNQLMKLMQFLLGLNEVFQPIRSSLLSRETNLDVKDAFAIISREESHKGIASSSSGCVSKPQITDLHQILEEVLLTECGDGVAGIKRRRRDPSSDGVRDLVTALGRSRKLAFVCIAVDTDKGNGVRKRITIGYGYSSVGRIDLFFRDQLLVFQQHSDESLYDSWTRFNDVIQKVPNHGLTDGDLRKFSDIGAWYAIEDCAQYDKKYSNPTSVISDETIANPNAQIVGDDMVRVQVPSTTYKPYRYYEEYTSPMTYPEEVEDFRNPDRGSTIERNKTRGNRLNHDIPLSSREIPIIDEPEPQPHPLPNCLSLYVSLGEERGHEPPIKPHGPDSFRMKEVDSLTTNIPPSPHVASSHPKDTYCYYRPCIDDPKKHYGFKPGLLGKSASLGVGISN